MRRRVTLGLLLSAFSLAGLGVTAHAHYLPTGRSLPGTVLLGHSQHATETIATWLNRVKDAAEQRTVALDAGDSQLQARFADLGVSLDVERTERGALQHAERGGLFTRWQRAWRARRGQEQIAPHWSFDPKKAALFLTELGPALAREPLDAKIDLANHTKIPDVAGREIDIESSLQGLQPLVLGGGSTLKLSFREVPATTRMADLIRVDVSKILASYETDFKGKAGRRKVNIERAVKYLNGTLIQPGETFSFNRTVGVRTENRGFISAPVIVDDIMEPGVGGGVCQVASTLFAAAIHGNLEVVRRRSHSRPSGYTPLGLDATVIDHEVDLRLQNPYDVPILIHAFLPGETTIKVELLGHTLTEKVEHQYSVTERFDFVRRVKPTIEVKEPKRKQRGNYGFDIVSVVTLTPAKGKPTRHSYASKYYPVPEVYWVPMDYDVSLLPALPEGATETIIGDKPIVNETTGAEPANKIAEPPS